MSRMCISQDIIFCFSYGEYSKYRRISGFSLVLTTFVLTVIRTHICTRQDDNLLSRMALRVPNFQRPKIKWIVIFAWSVSFLHFRKYCTCHKTGYDMVLCLSTYIQGIPFSLKQINWTCSTIAKNSSTLKIPTITFYMPHRMFKD